MAMLNNQMVTVWCFSHRRKYESQVGSWSLINGLRKTMIIEATKQEKWGLSELGDGMFHLTVDFQLFGAP